MTDGSEKLKVFSGTVILCFVDLFFLIFKIRQVGVFLGFADLLLLLRLSTKLDYPVTNRKLCFSLLDYALYLQVPIVPGHVHSIKDSVSTEDAADDYMFVIRQLVKTRLVSVSDVSDCPKFDLILVGMGPDGHVASLFPNHSALYETNEWITFITREDNTHIASASNVAIVVTGESKAKAVHVARIIACTVSPTNTREAHMVFGQAGSIKT
ncbi:hypothetical protein V6N13_080880 [Hibiscus sabdariffa]|uniref:Glucosamine/galactosamine-6-phosphate isomerase domain-containing protein n=2 Tax=Hibiscus sabdariffa TaxID=183260 RepID=A0ABR2NSE1_9ROSI